MATDRITKVRTTKAEVVAAAMALAKASAWETALAQRNRPTEAEAALEADAQYRVASDLRRRAQTIYDSLFFQWDGKDDPIPATAA